MLALAVIHMGIINTLRLLYGFQGGLCFVFYYGPSGLGYMESHARTYTPVRALLSSGSDDDIAIFLLGVVSVCLLILMMLKKLNLKGLNIIIILGSFLQLMALVLIEVGSLLDTIVYGRSLTMLSIVLCQIGIFIIWAYCNVNAQVKART